MVCQGSIQPMVKATIHNHARRRNVSRAMCWQPLFLLIIAKETPTHGLLLSSPTLTHWGTSTAIPGARTGRQPKLFVTAAPQSSDEAISALTSTSLATEGAEASLAPLSADDEASEVFGFAYGDELCDLRERVSSLREELHADGTNVSSSSSSTADEILALERRDPEVVYARAVRDAMRAESEGNVGDAAEFRREAELVRKFLPHLNFEGYWVGRYGSSYNLINVTYDGDTLIATKLTANANVPGGQVTFTADLSPLDSLLHPPSSSSGSSGKPEGGTRNKRMPLRPVELSADSAAMWGTKKLPFRFRGRGQIAGENFEDSEWVEGQLLAVDRDHFSFVWVTIGYHVFFARPPRYLWDELFRPKLGELPRYETDSSVRELQAAEAHAVVHKGDDSTRSVARRIGS